MARRTPRRPRLPLPGVAVNGAERRTATLPPASLRTVRMALVAAAALYAPSLLVFGREARRREDAGDASGEEGG